MRDWLDSLTVARVPEIALGLALGYALAGLAEGVAHIPVGVLTEHAGRVPGDPGDEALDLLDLYSDPYFLNFEIGGTIILYGPVLAAALAFGLVVLTAWLVVRRRDRELGTCPFCASRIPHESTHCAYCGSGLTLRDDDRAAPVG